MKRMDDGWLGGELRRVMQMEIWRSWRIYTKRDGHIRKKLYTPTFDRLRIGHNDHIIHERLCCCA